jgi:hypothetical protein
MDQGRYQGCQSEGRILGALLIRRRSWARTADPCSAVDGVFAPQRLVSTIPSVFEIPSTSRSVSRIEESRIRASICVVPVTNHHGHWVAPSLPLARHRWGRAARADRQSHLSSCFYTNHYDLIGRSQFDASLIKYRP